MNAFRNKITNRIFLFISVLGFTIVSCTISPQNKNNDQGLANTQAETTVEPQNENVQFRDSLGNNVSLDDLKGKVVFINFWATWCPPCIAEMPSINELKQSFNSQDDIVFLMVDVDNDLKKSTSFMKKKKFDLPVYTPGGPIPTSFLEGAIPTTVIIDKKGELIARLEGGRDYANPGILKALKDLIASK